MTYYLALDMKLWDSCVRGKGGAPKLYGCHFHGSLMDSIRESRLRLGGVDVSKKLVRLCCCSVCAGQAASKKQARLLKVSLSGENLPQDLPDMTKAGKLISSDITFMVLEMTLANGFSSVADRFDADNGTLRAKLPCALTLSEDAGRNNQAFSSDVRTLGSAAECLVI